MGIMDRIGSIFKGDPNKHESVIGHKKSAEKPKPPKIPGVNIDSGGFETAETTGEFGNDNPELEIDVEEKESQDVSFKSGLETHSKYGDENESKNEDAALLEGNVACVCDGAGSTKGAREASHTIAEGIRNYLKKNEILQEKGLPKMKSDLMVKHLQESFIQANQDLREYKQRQDMIGNEEVLDGKTTASASVFFRDGDKVKVVIGQVGDSNIFRLRNGKLERLTPEHSAMGDFARLGMDVSIEKVCAGDIKSGNRDKLNACSNKTLKEVVAELYSDKMDNVQKKFNTIVEALKSANGGKIPPESINKLSGQDRIIFNAGIYHANFGENTLGRLRNLGALGIGGETSIDNYALQDVQTFDVEDGDEYLLLSDGVTDSTIESELQRMINIHSGKDVKEQIKELVKYARATQANSPIKNKPDDISVVIMKADILENLDIDIDDQVANVA